MGGEKKGGRGEEEKARHNGLDENGSGRGGEGVSRGMTELLRGIPEVEVLGDVKMSLYCDVKTVKISA